MSADTKQVAQGLMDLAKALMSDGQSEARKAAQKPSETKPRWVIAGKDGKDYVGNAFEKGEFILYWPDAKKFMAGQPAQAAAEEWQRLARSWNDRLRQARENVPTAVRSRTAGIADAARTMKDLRDRGIAMNHDGSVYAYPFTGFGIPDLRKKPGKLGGDIDMAVRQQKHIVDSNEDKLGKMSKMLDATARFRSIANRGDAEAAKSSFDSEIKELKNNRVRDPILKSINSEIDAISDKIESGQIRLIDNNVDNIQEAGEQLREKWETQNFYFAKRKTLLEKIESHIRDHPTFLAEVATLGNPRKTEDEPDEESAEAVETVALDSKDRDPEGIFKRLMKSGGKAEFIYTTADGRKRRVSLLPKKFLKSKDGRIKVTGYDVDRKAERSFFIDMIS